MESLAPDNTREKRPKERVRSTKLVVAVVLSRAPEAVAEEPVRALEVVAGQTGRMKWLKSLPK